MNNRSRVGSWEPVMAISAAVFLVGVVSWYVSGDLIPMPAVTPGCSDGSMKTLNARLPVNIGWDKYYTNDENPFVPWTERASAAKDGRKPTPLEPKAQPEPKPEPNPPKRLLPTRLPGGGEAPRILGFQERPGEQVSANVLMPGETRTRLMKPGEGVGDWTFVGIAVGNIANFRDRDGRIYALVVGAGR